MTPTDPKALQLYTVTVETEVVVLASSESEAEYEARYAVRHDVDDLDAYAKPMRYMPGEWDRDAIPFGERDPADPNRTIGEWIDAGAAPEYRR
jgi:hypothetical protein